MEDKLTVINSKGSIINLNEQNNENNVNNNTAINYDNNYPISTNSSNLKGTQEINNKDQILTNEDNNKQNNNKLETKNNLQVQKLKPYKGSFNNKEESSSNDSNEDNVKNSCILEESSDSENSFNKDTKPIETHDLYPTISITKIPEDFSKEEDTQNTSHKHINKPTLIFDIIRRKSMQAILGSSKMAKSNSNSRNESSKDVKQNLTQRKKECFSSKDVISNMVNLSKHSFIKVISNEEMVSSTNDDDKEVIKFNKSFEEIDETSNNNTSNVRQNNGNHQVFTSNTINKFNNYSVIKETAFEDDDVKEKGKDCDNYYKNKQLSNYDANNNDLSNSHHTSKKLTKKQNSHSRESDSNKLAVVDYNNLSNHNFSDTSPLPKNEKSPSIKLNNNDSKNFKKDIMKNSCCKVCEIIDSDNCCGPEIYPKNNNGNQNNNKNPAITPKHGEKDSPRLNDSQLSKSNSLVDKILKDNEDYDIDENNSSF